MQGCTQKDGFLDVLSEPGEWGACLGGLGARRDLAIILQGIKPPLGPSLSQK